MEGYWSAVDSHNSYTDMDSKPIHVTFVHDKRGSVHGVVYARAAAASCETTVTLAGKTLTVAALLCKVLTRVTFAGRRSGPVFPCHVTRFRIEYTDPDGYEEFTDKDLRRMGNKSIVVWRVKAITVHFTQQACTDTCASEHTRIQKMKEKEDVARAGAAGSSWFAMPDLSVLGIGGRSAGGSSPVSTKWQRRK